MLYKSIYQTLNINALAIKEALQEKAIEKRFFISYDNMNFYEKARDQQFYNRGTLLNYTAGYVYFMNISESSINSDDNWYKCYLNVDQIDKEAVNDINQTISSLIVLHSIINLYLYTTLHWKCLVGILAKQYERRRFGIGMVNHDM